MSIPALGSTVHARTEVVTATDLSVCGALSGEASPRPLGIAFVLALRAVIESAALPDGAIMLGHGATWHEEPRPGTFRTEMSIRAAAPPRTRYQRVVIGYRTTAIEDGRLVLEQEQEVLWPVTA